MNIEGKTMSEEAQDEWMELAAENIHKLIPAEWMPRINEILPKVLNMVKIGIKKNIKETAKSLGDSKMYIMMNFPHTLPSGDTMQVPTMFRIDKSQLGPSVYDETTGLYELQLKEGEQPEATFSMLTLANKINSYENLTDLIKAVKDGTFLTLEDINYTGDAKEKAELAANAQKQIASSNPE